MNNLQKTIAASILWALIVNCNQSPNVIPELTTTYPAMLAAGESHYLVIEGHNFYPAVGWSTMDDEARLDFDYTVGLPGLPAGEVFVLGSKRLVAGFTPGADAPAGWYDLWVTSPTGTTGKLAQSVCVSRKKSLQLLYIRFRYQAGAIVGADLHSVDYLTHAGPWLLIENAVPLTGSGFALSPDGNLAAFYRFRYSGEDQFAQLVLARLGRTMDQVLWERLLVEIPQNGIDDYIELPVFSPDSRMIAYIENGRRLVAGPVPQEENDAFEPRILVEEPIDSGARLYAADISPDSDTVVYSRVSNPGSTLNEVDKSTLYRVSIGDPAPAELIPAAGGVGEHNAYGAFLPLGDRVLFLSDKLHLLINSPYGMLPVTGLHTVEPASGKIGEVMGPAATVLLSKPVVSPDGHWAACMGFLSDRSLSGIDMLIINLQNGAVFRTAADHFADCEPTEPNSDNCPTLDVAPAFDPASKKLFVTAIPYYWKDTGQGVMAPEPRDFYQYMVDLPDPNDMPDPGNATLPANSHHKLPAALDNLAVFARLRQLLDCP
ncbi:MAG TPA: hypothetical protein VM425_10965 [Myxococcota bacterium]|nr:hypothetical protein [Myxococcota bacterium]